MSTGWRKGKKADGSPPQKGGLVQFRADDRLLAELSQVADGLNLPVGVLARLWVSERLQKELSFDVGSIEAWRNERYIAIDKIVSEDFNPGPIQVIHLVPFQRQLEIDPERVRQYQGMLPPVERTDEFVGRINFDGYQTVKQFQAENKLAGSVQVFLDGRLESIRELRTDEYNNIFAGYIDQDFIRAIWSYSCALEALEVKPPVALLVTFKRMMNCRLKSDRFESPSAEIKCQELKLKGLTINNWEQVVKIENTAATVRRMLDRLANAAGISRSMSYSASGDWLGPIERPAGYIRKSKMIAKTELIELPGTNRDANRVELLMHEGDQTHVAGRVRAPYLEPTEKTRFRCLVNQDEMDSGVKEQLKLKHETKQPVTFSVGGMRFTGLITSFTEGMGAGAFDGIHLPQNWVLMFDVEQMSR